MCSFKIVQVTNNNGRKELLAVPSAWESCNKVKLPSKGMPATQVNYLLRDASSTPLKGWLEFDCILKRTGLKSFQEAISNMLSNSDTDSMPTPLDNNRNRAAKRRKIKNPDENRNDFNDQIQSLLQNREQTSCSNIPGALLPSSSTSSPIFYMANDPAPIQEHKRLLPSSSTTSQIVYVANDSMNETTVDLSLLVSMIQANSEKLDTLNTKMDLIMKRLDMHFDEPETSSLMPKEDYNPVATIEEILELNNNLKSDPEFYSKMFQYFKSMHPKSGKVSCEGVGYFYADKIWTRALIQKFSWTGLATANNSKSAFKDLSHLIKFFYNLVKAQVNCTEADVSIFLKQKIVHHSKRRAQSNRIRQSAPKLRTASKKQTKSAKQVLKETESFSENIVMDSPQQIVTIEKSIDDDKKSSHIKAENGETRTDADSEFPNVQTSNENEDDEDYEDYEVYEDDDTNEEKFAVSQVFRRL